MNIRTSRIARLRQSRTCAFCRRTILVRTAATLVVRSFAWGPRAFEYVHPGCGIALVWSRDGMAHRSELRLRLNGDIMTFPMALDGACLYPASTPTSTLRMDSAYVRAGL